MRNAYALLGVMFIMVLTGVYIQSSKEASAPAFLVDNQKEKMPLTLTSSAFSEGEMIPSAFTCDEQNINPPLTIAGVPEGTESLVLVMDDPDIPKEIKEARGIEKFNHWAVYNIPADTIDIKSGAALGSLGENSAGDLSYRGPCPPTEYEPTTHRYIFRLYALSGSLNFVKVPTLDEIEVAAQGMSIEKAELMGRYTRVRDENEDS